VSGWQLLIILCLSLFTTPASTVIAHSAASLTIHMAACNYGVHYGGPL